MRSAGQRHHKAVKMYTVRVDTGSFNGEHKHVGGSNKDEAILSVRKVWRRDFPQFHIKKISAKEEW